MTILYVYSDIVGSKDLSVYFLLCSSDLDREFFFFYFFFVFDRQLSFPFAFFRPLARNFLFLLLLKHICSLSVNGSSFLGGPFVPSSKCKGKNSYPRSRFTADELRFWLKRLVEGRT